MSETSTRRRPILWLTLLALLILGLGLHLSRAQAPPAVEISGDDRRPGHDDVAGPEGPDERVLKTLRPPAADQVPLVPPEEDRPGIPRSEEIDRLARISGEQIGERLKLAFDVEAYVHGEALPPFDRIEVSPETLETLLGLLSSTDAAVRRDAAIRLAAARLRAGDIPLLRAALEREILDATGRTSRHATLAMAYALAAQGERFGTERLETAVLSGERARDDTFRREAVLVLGMIGDPASSRALREVLRSDPLPDARVHAAQGLGRLGGDDNIMALAGSLTRDDGVEVRAWSSLAYGRAATRDGEQAGPLWASSRDDVEPLVRAASYYGLSRAGGPGTSRALVEAFHADPETLARIGVLAGLARRPNLGATKRAFVSGEGAEFLAAVARESDDHVALYFTARTLRRIPGDTARAALVTIMGSNRPDWVRTEAIRSLARHDGPGALPALRERLAAEERKEVRKVLAREIERLEGSAGK